MLDLMNHHLLHATASHYVYGSMSGWVGGWASVWVWVGVRVGVCGCVGARGCVWVRVRVGACARLICVPAMTMLATQRYAADSPIEQLRIRAMPYSQVPC